MAFIINISDIRDKIMAEIFDTEKRYLNGKIFWDRNFDNYQEFFFFFFFLEISNVKKLKYHIEKIYYMNKKFKKLIKEKYFNKKY